MAWTTRQLEILMTTSRVSSAFSLVGAFFIIITFCTSPAFHRPINRLAFFAAFGNILTNVATIISEDGIKAGIESPLCKVQGLLVQWFMPADALFCLAMALNVYLTVFKKYTTKRLKQLEPIYLLVCYGTPFILGITFLFIRDSHGTAIYGSATLWCWISADWQILRIAAFYGPVWIIIAATFFIYVLAGRVIFGLRSSLRGFARKRPPPPPPAKQVESHINIALAPIPPKASYTAEITSPTSAKREQNRLSYPNDITTTYTCTIETTSVKEPGSNTSESRDSQAAKPGTTRQVPARRNAAIEANTAAWAYCRCAMLFFLALVITWLPSSINRVYTLRYPEATNFGLNFAAALVLPAQGFWNGVIYTVTTLPACRKFFRDIYYRIQNPFEKWRRRQRGKETLGSAHGVADDMQNLNDYGSVRDEESATPEPHAV